MATRTLTDILGGESPIVAASAAKQGKISAADASKPEPNAEKRDPYEGVSSPIVGASYAKQGKITPQDALKPEYQQTEKTVDEVNEEKAKEAERKRAEEEAAQLKAAGKQSTLEQLRLLRQRMEAARQLTPEQKAKLAKRRQREAAISAIGDGLSALSNLFFTTKYAPNVKGQGQLSAKNQERWEKYNKEIKDTEKNYADALQKAEQAEAELQRKKDKDAADLALKKDADDRANRKADAAIEYSKAKTAASEAEAKLRAAKARAIEEGKDKEAEKIQAQIDELKSRAEKNKKQGEAAERNAKANETRAAKYNGGGSGGKGGKGTYYGEFDGEKYATRADYDKAVEDGAKENGVPTTEPNGFGKTKNRAVSKVAQETEAKIRQKKSTPKKATQKATKGSKLKNTSKLGL